MRTVQLASLRFAPAPVHFQKDHFSEGFATSLTDDRNGKRWRHLVPQEIPLGELVTFPLPLVETVKRTRRDDAVPENALGMATARARRRETTASHLAAAELDKPVKLTRRILFVSTTCVNARVRPSSGSLTLSGRRGSLHGEQMFANRQPAEEERC
jgi:hypothetical protein